MACILWIFPEEDRKFLTRTAFNDLVDTKKEQFENEYKQDIKKIVNKFKNDALKIVEDAKNNEE